MSRFYNVFLLFLVCFVWAAQAYSDIQHIDLYPIPEDKKSLLESWLDSGQFCFRNSEKSSERYCHSISRIHEIQIRNRGEWSNRPQDSFFVEMLPSSELETAHRFATFYIRCLDLNSDNRFVAEIYFIDSQHPTWTDRFGQTIFLTGKFYGDNINPIYPEIETISFGTTLEKNTAMLEALLHISKFNEIPSKNNLNSQVVNDHLPLVRIARQLLRLHALRRTHDDPTGQLSAN